MKNPYLKVQNQVTELLDDSLINRKKHLTEKILNWLDLTNKNNSIPSNLRNTEINKEEKTKIKIKSNSSENRPKKVKNCKLIKHLNDKKCCKSLVQKMTIEGDKNLLAINSRKKGFPLREHSAVNSTAKRHCRKSCLNLEKTASSLPMNPFKSLAPKSTPMTTMLTTTTAFYKRLADITDMTNANLQRHLRESQDLSANPNNRSGTPKNLLFLEPNLDKFHSAIEKPEPRKQLHIFIPTSRHFTANGLQITSNEDISQISSFCTDDDLSELNHFII